MHIKLNFFYKYPTLSKQNNSMWLEYLKTVIRKTYDTNSIPAIAYYLLCNMFANILKPTKMNN